MADFLSIIVDGMLGLAGSPLMAGAVLLIVLVIYCAMMGTPASIAALFIGSVVLWLSTPGSQGGAGVLPEEIFWFVAFATSIVILYGFMRIMRRSY